MNMIAKDALLVTDAAACPHEQEEVVVDNEISFEPQNQSVECDYTVAQAAKLLGKSNRQIQRLLTRGILNGYKVNGPCGLEWRVRQGLGAVNAQDSLESRFQHLSECIAELGREVNRLQDELEKSRTRERDLETAILVLVADDKLIKADIEVLKEAVTTIAVIAKDQQNNWFNRMFSKV